MKMKKVVEEVKDVIHLMNYKNIKEGLLHYNCILRVVSFYASIQEGRHKVHLWSSIQLVD